MDWRRGCWPRYDSFVAMWRTYLPLALIGLLGCDRLLHRHAPDASPPAVTDAASAASGAAIEATPPDDEDEATSTDGGGGACPLPIHPGYCRNGCRGYQNRSTTKHARRIGHAARSGFGTCGSFKVFAEDEQAGDAGVKSGIVEFFDTQGALVGAIDTRSKPCGQFGQIPACTPVVAWEGGHSPVSVRMGTVTVSGNQLPHEVIERIVRQNFGRFKVCYAKSKHPALEGRVVTKFVIATDGSVSSAQDDGSDLADKDVTACVVRSFSGLLFPQPSGGSATVTFPVVFSP